MVLPVNVVAGHSRGAAQACGSGVTPLLRVWWISPSLITSSALDMTNHISHTCGRSSRPARYSSSSTHSHTSKRWLTTAHFRALRTKQRRGSKASGFRKQCHEGSTTSSHVVTPLVYSCCSTYSSKLYLYSSWNAYILRLSEIRPVPWFLTEEAEVLVDPSTWSNLNKVDPGTNDRDYMSILIVLQSYVRILLFAPCNVLPYCCTARNCMSGEPHRTVLYCTIILY